MPIIDSTLRRVRYYPELLGDSQIYTTAAGAVAAPNPLLLTQVAPNNVALTHLNIAGNAAIMLDLRADSLRHSSPSLPIVGDRWTIRAKRSAEISLRNIGVAAVNNQSLCYSLWVYKPNVVQKIAQGDTLTPDERKIADEYNLYEPVEKGIRPMTIPGRWPNQSSYMLEREYEILEEISPSFVTNIGVAETVISEIASRPDEAIIITGIWTVAAAAPGDNVRIRISRDNDDNLVEIVANGIGGLAGMLAARGGVPLWIPALNVIRISTIATVANAAHAVGFSMIRVRITDILRARWGLASRDELPGNVWDKVMGGIL